MHRGHSLVVQGKQQDEQIPASNVDTHTVLNGSRFSDYIFVIHLRVKTLRLEKQLQQQRREKIFSEACLLGVSLAEQGCPFPLLSENGDDLCRIVLGLLSGFLVF